MLSWLGLDSDKPFAMCDECACAATHCKGVTAGHPLLKMRLTSAERAETTPVVGELPGMHCLLLSLCPLLGHVRKHSPCYNASSRSRKHPSHCRLHPEPEALGSRQVFINVLLACHSP